jgi:hypothetical protein
VKRILVVHLDGLPVSITARDSFKLLNRSFTVGRSVYHKWPFKGTAFVTFCHECVHVLQYQEAKGRGFLRVVTFLFSYLGKKLLRAILPKRFEPSDMYEDEANREEASVAAGTHARITIPVETRNVFG